MLYKPDGTCGEVLPAVGKSFTLAELQAHVGGCVELVPNPRIAPLVALADEEGRMKGLPANRNASLLLGYLAVGNVLLLTQEELGD